MYLVDTNVISELRRGTHADVAVRAWALERLREDLYCSAISILELRIGALRALRKDPPKGRLLREWLEVRVIPDFGDRIIAVDTEIALACAPLHVPDPKPHRDAFIAATALVHDLTVVTRNTSNFERMGVKLLNPWMPQQG